MKGIDLTNEQKHDAIMNATPIKPVKHELGGGVYYTCRWIKCGGTVTKWYNYCPKCGQKIDWSDE